MMKLYLDAGTTWSKIIAIHPNKIFLAEFEQFQVDKKKEKSYFIIPSKQLQKSNRIFDKATGHMSLAKIKDKKDHINEIIALSLGAKPYINDEAIILDLGSRDTKWVKFVGSKFKDLDWNSSCASATGATIEMLTKFYDIDVDILQAHQEKHNVTCGIFGLEKIMDDIANGIDPSCAIAKFIHGIAFNAWNFTKKPNKLYLSGGFCENRCFIDSLSNYAQVIPIGRFTLCEGLIEE